MYSTKVLLAAAALAVSSLATTANAAPWDHRDGDHRGGDHRFEDRRVDNHFENRRGPEGRREFHRPIVERMRIYDTLRFRHYRGIGDPYFVHGHYVVRTINPFGRTVFVEVDPYSGAFLGEFRI